VITLSFGLVSVCYAQNTPAPQTPDPQSAAQATAPPSPLTTPAITGPLQAAPPIVFDGGPLGKLDLNGIVSGTGLWQGNHISGDDVGQAALSNGQLFIQKTTGCGSFMCRPVRTTFWRWERRFFLRTRR